MPGLTGVGICWALLSFIASLAICIGFYLPNWLVSGHISYAQNWTAVSFGSFRRCGYLKLEAEGVASLTDQCGRYKSFSDIPGIWWQCATILVGVGGGLSLLTAFVALPGCCFQDVISRTTAMVLGGFQVIAGLLVLCGLVMYPLGWGNNHVREACGDRVASYLLGRCTIGWSFWCILGGALLILICGSLSTRAGRPLKWKRLKVSESTSHSSSTSRTACTSTTSPVDSV